jgi:hypothetical protein
MLFKMEISRLDIALFALGFLVPAVVLAVVIVHL